MSRKKMAVLIVGSILVLLVIVSVSLTKEEKSKSAVELSFSNTMSWDTDLLAKAQSSTIFTDAQLAKIQLLPAPANDSELTKTDLKTMHTYMDELRTPEQLAEIDRERQLKTAVFGTEMYGDLMRTHPRTEKLIEKTIEFITPVLMAEKLKYNRVRPSFLDPTLTTTIVIPLHPAYPGGHATESHLFALILGKLNPKNADAYMNSAERIAKNREIAGVHYPSDSEAGKLLAEQLLPLLLENKEFVTLFNSAKAEW